MNITLINPPISLKERYRTNIGVAGGRQLCLGICYIAAYLREHKYNVKIIDAEAEEIFDYNKIVSMIKEFKTDIIGITSTTVSFHRALELAKKIKQNCQTLIVLGGSHITAMPEYTMKFKEFDYGVLKEGEETILELIEAIKNKKSVSRVKGIVYRDKKGKVKFTKPREYIKDLDSLPMPAIDLVKFELYRPPLNNYRKELTMSMITNRGCDFKCTFCDRNVFGGCREHSAKRIVSEIERLIKYYNVKEITFEDDTFLANKNRVRDFIKLLELKGINISFSCAARVNQVDEELLKELKKVGCYFIAFGIESGNQEILNTIRKGITIKQIKDAINLCKKIGIQTKGFFIIGCPLETKETIRQTINFAKSLPLDDIIVTLMCPIPGTEMFRVAKNYGILDESDYSKFSYHHPVFVPKGLTAEYLKKIQGRFYREFYLRFSMILNKLKQLNSFENLKRLLIGFKAVLSA